MKKSRKVLDKVSSTRSNAKKDIPQKVDRSKKQPEKRPAAFDYTSSDDELFDKKSNKTVFRRQRNKKTAKPSLKEKGNGLNNLQNKEIGEAACGVSTSDDCTGKHNFGSNSQAASGLSGKDSVIANVATKLLKKCNVIIEHCCEPTPLADTHLPTITSRMCPVCNNSFPSLGSDNKFSRHVNTCLDMSSAAESRGEDVDINKEQSLCQLSSVITADEEFAKQLQRREEEKSVEEKLNEELFFCSFCQKELTRFNTGQRRIHLNKCADFHEQQVVMNKKAEIKLFKAQHGESFECIICGLQFSNITVSICEHFYWQKEYGD